MRFKKSVSLAVSSVLSLGVLFGASTGVSSAQVASSSGSPAVQYKLTIYVKCPVVNLRNEATGDYIEGSGPTKAAAVKDANNKVFSRFGKGYKLKHCRHVSSSDSFGF